MMATTIADIDIELKMKISRIGYLESELNSQTFKRVWYPAVCKISKC